MVAWPGSLPQSPLLEGFSEQGEEQSLRTTMDVGPDKLRKRASAVPTVVKFNMIMDETQRGTLENFYDSTLNGGSLDFTFTDPLSNTQRQFRFIRRHTIRPIAVDTYLVSFEWERLP